MGTPLPPEGSVERWAYDYVSTDVLRGKLEPPPLPAEWADEPEAEACILLGPGRPKELRIELKGRKTPGKDALKRPEARAQLLHTFLHHELQAAELMCRAVLAFPDAPPAFRRGLIKICLDEVRHMRMYAEHLATLGFAFGDFPVNDWFWRKLPAQTTRLQFVALMGLGFEGANLDHTQRFAQRFRAAGDSAGARLQERVGEEEIPHVAFGAHWFKVFAGEALSFEAWQAALVPPLSPLLMRGRPLNREARRKAGYPDAFTDALEAYKFKP